MQRIAPVQVSLPISDVRSLDEANLFQQGQLSRRVVIELVPLVIGGAVVVVEVLPFEAGSQPIRRGDDPLQKRIRLVMAGGGVYDGVIRVTLLPGSERRHVLAHQFRQNLFQQVEADGRVGRVDMGISTIEIRTVELLFDFSADIAVGILLLCLSYSRTFGEFA